jgi:hypothetical protein
MKKPSEEDILVIATIVIFIISIVGCIFEINKIIQYNSEQKTEGVVTSKSWDWIYPYNEYFFATIDVKFETEEIVPSGVKVESGIQTTYEKMIRNVTGTARVPLITWLSLKDGQKIQITSKQEVDKYFGNGIYTYNYRVTFVNYFHSILIILFYISISSAVVIFKRKTSIAMLGLILSFYLVKDIILLLPIS